MGSGLAGQMGMVARLRESHELRTIRDATSFLRSRSGDGTSGQITISSRLSSRWLHRLKTPENTVYTQNL